MDFLKLAQSLKMSKQKTLIYVIRHGESAFNVSLDIKTRLIDGKLESPLTDIGKTQAKKLAKKLTDVELVAIYASDLSRTKETAEIIALEKNLKPVYHNTIRERSVHDYHKLNEKYEFDELMNIILKHLSTLDETGKMKYKHTPLMESAEEGAIRLLSFIKEAVFTHQGKAIAIVCHGNIMRSLLTHLGFAKYDELPHGSIENTGYFVLESDGIDFFVKEAFGVNKRVGEFRNF